MCEELIFLGDGTIELKRIINARGDAELHGKIADTFDARVKQIAFDLQDRGYRKAEIMSRADVRRLIFLETINGGDKILVRRGLFGHDRHYPLRLNVPLLPPLLCSN